MKWFKCSEQELPDINQRFILIRYKDIEDGYFKYYIYLDCPYGWNVLERLDAEFTTLRIS